MSNPHDPGRTLTTADARAEAIGEWRRGWPLPTISLCALTVAFSHIYVMGLFTAPLQTAFGWSRTAAASGLTIVSVISVVLAPFVGMWIDRIGARTIATAGILLYCLSFAALGASARPLWTWWLLWTAVGIGSVFLKPTVWAMAISTRFSRSRGLAMAVALCGSGLGGILLPPLSTGLIDRLGWRGAFAAIGLGELAIVLPLILLFFRPSARAGARGVGEPPKQASTGMTVRNAMRGRRFLVLASATLLITTALLALVVHLVPILVEGGASKRDAAFIASMLGMGTIVGRLVTGAVLDRVPGNRVGLVVFATPIAACAILLGARTVPGGMVAAAILGLSIGSEVDIVMYLASRYFGLRNFGVIYGTLSGLTSLGTGLGPLLAGAVFDRSGSYDPLLIGLMPTFAVAALLVGALGPYPTTFCNAGDPDGKGR